jgi:RNA polymerase sigma-70 factor (ECF subfamily)
LHFLRCPLAAGVLQMMDPHWLGQLIDDHAAALVLYAAQWCCAPDDVVQEAFLHLAGQRHMPDNGVAWLYRVVRNRAISAGRSEQRRRRHETGAAANTPRWLAASEGAALDARAAAEALQGLPVELREPLVAHLWGGLPFERIGALMGVSTSTAHRRYLEGLATLRERLGVSCSDLPAMRRPGQK